VAAGLLSSWHKPHRAELAPITMRGTLPMA